MASHTITLSQDEASALDNKIESAKNTVKRIREKAAEMTGRFVGQAEAAATAYGFGYARGRKPDTFAKGIFGQAPDMITAALGDMTVVMGWAGGVEEHVFAVATGALCSYTTAFGMKQGAAAATAAKEKAGPYLGDPSMGAAIHAEGSDASTKAEIASLLAQLASIRAAA